MGEANSMQVSNIFCLSKYLSYLNISNYQESQVTLWSYAKTP